MAGNRCRFAVNLITFTLPLIICVVLICMYFGILYNSCVNLIFPFIWFLVGVVFLFGLGMAGLIAFRQGEAGINLYFRAAAIFGVLGWIPVLCLGIAVTSGNFGAGQWNHIIACVAPSIGCDRFNQTYTSSQQLSSAHLTPLQSGCCMPPSECGLSFVSPIYWAPPTSTNQTSYVGADCTIWNNDPKRLCYSCDSCKHGLLPKTAKKWRCAFYLLLATYLGSILISFYNCCYSNNW